MILVQILHEYLALVMFAGGAQQGLVVESVLHGKREKKTHGIRPEFV
jgi:hypothetical protein